VGEGMIFGGNTRVPATRSPAEIRVNLQSISTELVVAEQRDLQRPQIDNRYRLLDPKIGGGLFAATALNLVLDVPR
jgi:hypothetical protein